MKALFLSILLIISHSANSDITGAGDAALFTELKLITANTLEQIKQYREMIDVQEKMKEIEELKVLKKLTQEGKALSDSVRNVNATANELNEWEEDPLGLNQTERELENIKALHEQAKSEGDLDRAATLGRLLQDLGRLSMLEEANKKNLAKQGEGTNEEDDAKITAQSSLIMSDILTEKERRDSIVRAQEATAVQDLFKGTNYGSMGKGE